jgi:hypothetical protein
MRAHDLLPAYYHGSMEHLPVGTILKPRGTDYEASWGNTAFYAVLERYRPSHMLGHKHTVFMVSDTDDVDLAGGGTEWLFTVKPLGPVSKHDMNWSSEISMLTDDGHDMDSPQVKKAAENYWQGVPHPNESVWEYLTPAAEILKVEAY